MTAPSLPRELALKVGLASRALPGFSPAQMLELLIELVGMPLTEAGLQNLKVKDLKIKLAEWELEQPIGPDDCKRALAILKGDDADTQTPTVLTPQPYQDGDMPQSIRVAIASNSADLDGHFGSCLHFLIHQVSADEARLIDIRSTRGDAEVEEKNDFRAALIADCQLLVVQSIGGPAAAKVVKHGVHPLKVPPDKSMAEVLTHLRQSLQGNPAPFLAKIMGSTPEERVRFEWAEASDE